MIAWFEPQLRKNVIEALARDERKRLHARRERAEDLVEKLVRPRSLRNAGKYFIEHFGGERILIRYRWLPSASGGSPRYARQCGQPGLLAGQMATARPDDPGMGVTAAMGVELAVAALRSASRSAPAGSSRPTADRANAPHHPARPT